METLKNDPVEETSVLYSRNNELDRGPALSETENTIAGNTGAEAVFQVRGISKVYRMGDVEVHALRSVDLDLYKGERTKGRDRASFALVRRDDLGCIRRRNDNTSPAEKRERRNAGFDELADGLLYRLALMCF